MRCAGIAALVVALGLPSCAETVSPRPDSGSIASRSTCQWTTSNGLAVRFAPGRATRRSSQSRASRARQQRAPVCESGSPRRPAGFYRVSVVQDIPAAPCPWPGLEARCHFGGGIGAVSFRTLGATRLSPNAPRDAIAPRIIDAIGKGIGRTGPRMSSRTRLLPRLNLHDQRRDRRVAGENGTADRAELAVTTDEAHRDVRAAAAAADSGCSACAINMANYI